MTRSTADERVTVGLDVDGYDVEVDIPIDKIRRQIERQEERDYKAINKRGPSVFDCSKYVTVSIEPTWEKWGELADREFPPDDDGAEDGCGKLGRFLAR